MKKKIGNIGYLDLTEMEPEVIEEIEGIDNVGYVVFTDETEPRVMKLHIGNIGHSLKVPKGCKISQDDMELSHAYFEATPSPSFLISGTLSIRNDVTEEDIRSIEYLHVSGPVICPPSLIPVVQAKADVIQESIVPWFEGMRILTGKVEIDTALLGALKEPTPILAVGNVSMIGEVDTSLLDRISSLNVIGKMTIREEYYETLLEKLGGNEPARLKVIPAGYEYITDPLLLDGVRLKQFGHAKLYVQDRIQITDDVTPELLKKHVGIIRTNDVIICRESLREAVLGLCEDPSAKILYYSGKILVVEDRHTLTNAELKYQPECFSILVLGRLDIQDDVDPEDFLRRLEYVDNYGKISANEDLCGVLRFKMRTQKGILVNTDRKKPEKQDTSQEYFIKNAGYLKL